MNAFEFHCPTKIICGKNALHKLPAKMADRNVTKPLIVTDENLVKLGIAEHVFAPLKEADIPYVVYDQVPPRFISDSCKRSCRTLSLTRLRWVDCLRWRIRN